MLAGWPSSETFSLANVTNFQMVAKCMRERLRLLKERCVDVFWVAWLYAAMWSVVTRPQKFVYL